MFEERGREHMCERGKERESESERGGELLLEPFSACGACTVEEEGELLPALALQCQ